MVLKTNALFPSQFVLMSMELITCHVTNRLAFLGGTYFLVFFFFLVVIKNAEWYWNKNHFYKKK